jgi:hypothetical protein
MTLPRLVIQRPVRSLKDIEPTPKWIERLPTYVGWGLIWLATLVGAYGFRAMQDFDFAIHTDELAAQASRDIAAADSLVAGCMSRETANRLLGVSERTAGLLAQRRALQRWVLHLTAPRGELVAEVED